MAANKKQMTYSQRKRASYDYRNEYFKHNPGFLGCIWKCAYCQRLIIGRSNVQVDHIMPLNNPLGMNARFNLVAACPRCNHAKSDKAGMWTIWGYINKIFEVIFGTIQKLVILILVAAWTAIQRILGFVAKVLTKPYRDGGIVTKLIATIIYGVIIYHVYQYVIGG